MPLEVELRHSEPIPTAVVRDRVAPKDFLLFVPAACGEVWNFVRAFDLPNPGRHVALYLDGQGNVEVGVELSEPFVGSGSVLCSELPSGLVATTVLFGPYSRLSEAHAAIREWCAAQGHVLTGVSWEIYGHWEDSWNDDLSKVRTDVFHLIQASGE